MEFAGIVLQALAMLGAVIAALIGLYTRAHLATVSKEIEALRADIEAGRAADRQAMQEWINGSFMRSATVEAKLDHVDGWLSSHEKRLDRLEEKR